MLSIIISWRDRLELKRALPTFIETAALLDGEINIVNFSGSDELLNDLIGENRTRVKVTKVDNQHYFNKAAAQNVGASTALHPVLFFCDCDIILEPAQLVELYHRVAGGDRVFATLAGVSETEINSRGAGHVVSFGYELNIRTADGRTLKIVDNEEDSENGTRQAPGLLMVKKQDFIAINGYNSQLHGWGWEDQDMISRLTLGLGLERIISGEALHISHDDHARLAFYPEVASRWESRDRMFRTALANYDNNDFAGSYSADIADCSVS
ncbi:glycosyl transferase family 2 [Thalassomonas viridans]|uniref:Glycosyl transferase family 2 n=1 Tax=Thalassomonas viridans TaxID=137584 RepID=A0AAE9ZA39_9GAMM|nr:galactosyltransferase-related protein [Thalassomonas viridans]WDE09273.1 glycosyl transferase family 2 [Thalassomonas viridans]